MKEKHSTIRGKQPAESMDSWVLVVEGLIEVMEKVPLSIAGNERFSEIYGELVRRLEGKVICDGCREKAKHGAQEPS